MPKSQSGIAALSNLKSQSASEIATKIASKSVEKLEGKSVEKLEGRNRNWNRNHFKSLRFQKDIASGLDLKSLAIWASKGTADPSLSQ